MHDTYIYYMCDAFLLYQYTIELSIFISIYTLFLSP